MTKEIQHHLKGRIRDKVKQVILIEGIPEILYRIKQVKVVVIKYNNKKYRLDIPTDLMNELKKLQTIELSESTRTTKSFKPLIIPGIGHRTTIRAVNGNTHITVGGNDEKQLAERIQMVKEHLASLGIDSIERCHWVCSTDKAKPNNNYSYPHKLTDTHDLNKATLKTNEPKVSEKKEMSSHTKSLRDIHLKLIDDEKKDKEKRP